MKKKPVRMVTCCLAGALLVATPVYASPVAGVTEITNHVVENELNTSSPVAGVSLALAKYMEDNNVQQDTGAETDAVDDGASADADEASEKEEKKKTASAKSEKKKDDTDYSDMAVAQVSDYINIRQKPDENSELVGKLYKDSVATVVKKSGEWYKIKSGSVTGYVKGEYIAVGDEDLVKSVGVKIATVTTTTLKVREKASDKAEVLTLVPGGEELKVTSLEDYKDGWVKVAVDGGRGYVSSDYIEISRQYTYAESRQEEEARIAAEEAAKAAEEAAKAAEEAAKAAENSADASNSSSQGSSSQNSSSSQSASSQSSSSSQSGSSQSNSFAKRSGGDFRERVRTGSCKLCLPVRWQSVCIRRDKPDKRRGLFRLCHERICAFRRIIAAFFERIKRRRPRRKLQRSAAGRHYLLQWSCCDLYRK